MPHITNTKKIKNWVAAMKDNKQQSYRRTDNPHATVDMYWYTETMAGGRQSGIKT
jgi:hypothetical protein